MNHLQMNRLQMNLLQMNRLQMEAEMGRSEFWAEDHRLLVGETEMAETEIATRDSGLRHGPLGWMEATDKGAEFRRLQHG